MCRFLLAQPSSEYDRQHSIRFCSGNGLRQNIWISFVQRFNIKNIYEFYGATESNAYFCNITFDEKKINSSLFVIVNLDAHPGACGFFSVLCPSLLGSVFAKFDPETMQPIRDETTKLCIQSQREERGLLLGMIRTDLIHAFDGYVNNSSETNHKIVKNVCHIGDRAFNTGRIEF